VWRRRGSVEQNRATGFHTRRVGGSFPVARLGFAARGVVDLGIGCLAALTADPHHAWGLSGARRAPAPRPWGP
jgi:hypothetical protein